VGSSTLGTNPREESLDRSYAFIPMLPSKPLAESKRRQHQRTLRQSPKGTDFSPRDTEEVDTNAASLNARPRKTLSWKTQAEAFNRHLRSLQNADGSFNRLKLPFGKTGAPSKGFTKIER
jgi:hypothetical protein